MPKSTETKCSMQQRQGIIACNNNNIHVRNCGGPEGRKQKTSAYPTATWCIILLH